jgi:hypothetical protein
MNAQRRCALGVAVTSAVLLLPLRLPAQTVEAHSGDRVAEDAAPPTEGGAAIVEQTIADQADAAALVVDATLAKGISYIPAPLRVVVTAYVFKVNDVVSGADQDEYIVVYDTGGVLPDGTKMETVESFKLTPGDRYLVFAERVSGEYWARNVLQVLGEGQTLADASGRTVVGVEAGNLVVEPRVSQERLRYSTPVERPAPVLESAPASGSLPVPEQPAVPSGDAAPLKLDRLKQFLRSAQRRTEEGASIPLIYGGKSEEGADSSDDGKADETSDDAAAGAATDDVIDLPVAGPSTVLSGQHVAALQSHYYFMPDNNHWAWTQDCLESWNRLVLPTGGFRLFAFRIDASGNPIRNRPPVANNGEYNLGVLTDAQMTAGGYSTWPVLGANGVCYRWSAPNNRITETDILINPAIAFNEPQYRKSLTHELGHALTLDHETRYMALLFPGTFQQPPNYASLWYSRWDDHWGVTSMLQWVNQNIAAGSWNIAQFVDMATWAQAHSNPGTNGSLVMTSLSSLVLNRGQIATVRRVHVENRGLVAAQNVSLRFYLSADPIISPGDIELASYGWPTFLGSWTGELNIQVPAGTPVGLYYVGWILTTNSGEITTGNNVALMLNDMFSNFSPVRVQIQ